jgi:hypothetical protein
MMVTKEYYKKGKLQIQIIKTIPKLVTLTHSFYKDYDTSDSE